MNEHRFLLSYLRYCNYYIRGSEVRLQLKIALRDFTHDRTALGRLRQKFDLNHTGRPLPVRCPEAVGAGIPAPITTTRLPRASMRSSGGRGIESNSFSTRQGPVFPDHYKARDCLPPDLFAQPAPVLLSLPLATLSSEALSDSSSPDPDALAILTMSCQKNQPKAD